MAMFPSQLLLSSKHHKERLLQPIFEPYGVALITNLDFDTDQFGTFCGATPRPEGPQTTVKEKCLAGMAFANKQQGLASEGSFGPHPHFPFLTLNEEWLVYIDLAQNLEVYGRSLSLEVCHQQLHYQNGDLDAFLTSIEFGAQGLVLKNAKNGEIIAKGITKKDHLTDLIQKHPQWTIETDLRAHLNPLRQKNIIAAGRDLLARMQSCCPICAQPDFSVRAYSGQLKCSGCQKPTQTHEFLEYHCTNCLHHMMEKRKDKVLEDPQFCNHCNP
ncbi:MAG: hypothetical protein RI948_1510 [Bacteroidota bacterium]|jgi:DNA-directed RNA polymerase subunit RPC12/RpoP